MAMRLTFYGGAGKVTGSNFMVESEDERILIDCGVEQGADVSPEHMLEPFAYEPGSVRALVVTHAHLDHVGRIPKLVRDGFRGPIYCTPATRDLTELILRDSVEIIRIEAERAGRPVLYEARDADAALEQMRTIEYHTPTKISEAFTVTLANTGHILGSGSVTVEDRDGVRLGLTGDIGNSPSPLLPDWEPLTDVHAMVMESVYGDRAHPGETDRVKILRDELKSAIQRGGTILIPAFSLERTQLMLYELSNFFSAKELPQIPVFLDSPLAINVTKVYEKWGPTYFKSEIKAEMMREGSIFSFPFLTQTLHQDASEQIKNVPGPKIIIAGAGMSHGGRIGKWEALYAPDRHSTLIMVGYQAPGSPGRRLAEGAKTVRLHGEEVSVRAKVLSMEGWSGHADRDELVTFAEQSLAGGTLKTIFTAIGEPASERFLAQRIHDYLGARAIVPEAGSAWTITQHGVQK